MPTDNDRLKSIAWFNNEAYHSIASSLFYLDQAYIRYKTNQSEFTMHVVNEPLPKNTTHRVTEQILG